MKNEVLKSLKKLGYRITNSRKELITVLAEYKVPVSISEISKRYKSKKMPFNLSSIYNNIKTLITSGHLIEINNTNETKYILRKERAPFILKKFINDEMEIFDLSITQTESISKSLSLNAETVDRIEIKVHLKNN